MTQICDWSTGIPINDTNLRIEVNELDLIQIPRSNLTAMSTDQIKCIEPLTRVLAALWTSLLALWTLERRRRPMVDAGDKEQSKLYPVFGRIYHCQTTRSLDPADTPCTLCILLMRILTWNIVSNWLGVSYEQFIYKAIEWSSHITSVSSVCDFAFLKS